jgi:hypothetical protein
MKTLVMNEVFRIGDITLQVCSDQIIFTGYAGIRNTGYYLTNTGDGDNKLILEQSGLTKDTLISGLKCHENEVNKIGTFPYFRSLALLTLAAEYLEKTYNDLQEEDIFHLPYSQSYFLRDHELAGRYIQWNPDFYNCDKEKGGTYEEIITNTPGWLTTTLHGCMSMARWADGEILIMPIGFKPITHPLLCGYIKVGDAMCHHKRLLSEAECYSNSSGKKFGTKYNLNLFEFNTRTILEISNGYIRVSGFGAGWFLIDEVFSTECYSPDMLLGQIKLNSLKYPVNLLKSVSTNPCNEINLGLHGIGETMSSIAGNTVSGSLIDEIGQFEWKKDSLTDRKKSDYVMRYDAVRTFSHPFSSAEAFPSKIKMEVIKVKKRVIL